MKASDALGIVIQQAEFAVLVGVSEAKVSQMLSDGVLQRGQTGHAWLLAYCERLREQAAGRQSGELGGLDLVQERAALARAQRETYDLRNAVTRGEFAPISLLTEVLAMASQSVVDRLDQLPGQLHKVAPDLPDMVRQVLDTTIASARNEWVRATIELVVRRFDEAEDEAQPDPFDADEAPT